MCPKMTYVTFVNESDISQSIIIELNPDDTNKYLMGKTLRVVTLPEVKIYIYFPALNNNFILNL